MQALVYTAPHEMELREISRPTPPQGEDLIEVKSVGICGSDMHGYLGHDERRPAPLVLGHEAAGVVASTNARVTVNPLVTCGSCPACISGRTNLCPDRQIISMPPRAGAFSQYLSMPSRNLIPIPDDLSFDQAALAEPLAVCWHAVRLCAALPDADLAAPTVVIGGGAIGFGCLLALQAFGATDVSLIETNTHRAAHLRGLTDAPICEASQLREDGAALVVDCVGFGGTRETACALTRPGGTICHIGLGDSAEGLDVRRITLQEITFFGTYAYTDQDLLDTVEAMTQGRLGKLDWAETRPLSDGAEAFADILAGRVLAPKVILHP
ncbi:alcohol dehydrogenase catalytic domain-containing protein [uncultured Litoreibacter sp.]|uniref:alcohol dehydrogenase catalytic domain-containing protein n=1 Tax=uncultured Litoreibacter sp. TaxID=1392394 RepID=UPI00263018A0|nr:alcohol dehydrogenase catalytic domain-containing protein [uncultured Litoreibacter sp.]